MSKIKRKIKLPKYQYSKTYITTYPKETRSNVASQEAIFALYGTLAESGPVEASIISNFTLKIINEKYKSCITCIIRRPDEFRTKFVYKTSNDRKFKIVKWRKRNKERI